MIKLKSAEEIKRIRQSCQIARRIVMRLGEEVRPGRTPTELDRLARQWAAEAGVKPSFLGYKGYPAAICVAPNEVVVHGIPTSKPLQEGDLVGLDFGAYLNGYHGDTAYTFPVGSIRPEVRSLMEITEASLYQGIKQARVGNRLGDIGHAIQSYVEARGCGVVRTLVGHGIGRDMQEDPPVPNVGKPRRGVRLRPGMTLAIEPMITQGGYEVEVLPDKWTVVTKDRSLSAHYEHTIVILSDGPEILSELPE